MDPYFRQDARLKRFWRMNGNIDGLMADPGFTASPTKSETKCKNESEVGQCGLPGSPLKREVKREDA